MRTEKATKEKYFIDAYNNLDGKIISRKELEKFIKELHNALKVNQDIYIKTIHQKLASVLKDNSEHQNFKIKLKNKLEISGLNAARHRGVAKQGLNKCGRLNKGYKYQNGRVVRVGVTKKKIVTKTKAKIKIKYIRILYAEGSFDDYPKKYLSWIAANKGLMSIYKDSITDYIGGYNKVAFEVVFQDNEKYEGRLDVSPTEDNPTRTNNVIGKHIKEFLEYMLTSEAIKLYKRTKKEVNEVKDWLKTYDLGVIKNIEPTYKEFKKGDKVFLIDLLKKVRGRHNPLYNKTGIVEHSQKKDVNVNVKDYGNVGLLPKNLVKLISKSVKKKGLTGAVKNKILPFSEQEKIETAPVAYYKIKGAIRQLLGDVEIKPKESVVITIDAPQGAGKTTLSLQFAHEFAANDYDVLYLSLEEHKESDLFKSKVRKYISKTAQNNFFPISEIEKDYNKLIELIQDYDVIVIDSFKKLKKIFKRIDLDEDLRKKVDGKLFIVLYQLTQKGEMRGGSDAQFDGDIILKIKKSENFKENYCVADKNRYQNKDIHTLKYNVFYKRMVRATGSKKG